MRRKGVNAWGTPIVSVYAMRQAFFRDAKANYNDIVLWSKPSDWKIQISLLMARMNRIIDRSQVLDAISGDDRSRADLKADVPGCSAVLRCSTARFFLVTSLLVIVCIRVCIP